MFVIFPFGYFSQVCDSLKKKNFESFNVGHPVVVRDLFQQVRLKCKQNHVENSSAKFCFLWDFSININSAEVCLLFLLFLFSGPILNMKSYLWRSLSNILIFIDPHYFESKKKKIGNLFFTQNMIQRKVSLNL